MKTLDKDIMKKMARLDRQIVIHPDWKLAHDGILACMERSRYFVEPEGCLLLASGGMGKTRMCKTIVDAHRPYIRNEEGGQRSIVPAFYAEIPSPATVKSVASELLTKLNDPNPKVGNSLDMTNRLCLLLRSSETRLVLLDEVHNLFDLQSRTTKINRKVCSWIKKLVNDSKITFCLVGLPRIEPLLSIEDDETQLSRRFKSRYRLTTLTLGNEETPSTLKHFLHKVRNNILTIFEPEHFPDIESDLYVLQIYAATSGNPSYVMALIKAVISDVFNAGGRSISISDFATVWRSGILIDCHLTKENPFELGMAALAGELR